MSESSFNLPHPHHCPTLTVVEAGKFLGLKKDQAYRSCRAGNIPTIRLSIRRIVVPTSGLYELLGIPVEPIRRPAPSAQNAPHRR